MSLAISLQMLRQKLLESYPYGGPKRFPIPQDKISWSIGWPDYNPPFYTAKRVLEQPPWADKELIPGVQNTFKWNSIDGLVNRVSYLQTYQIDKDGFPLNPVGRTGIKGRGLLGKWGPNHAADPIITRWKPKAGESKILQFIGIQRRDSQEWAIPGGNVDAGEDEYTTCKREFLEEVYSIENASADQKQEIELAVQSLFNNGIEVYKGYVDDPRNTDNAWMETIAVNYHMDPSSFDNEKYERILKFKAGSDAMNAKWIDISSALNLYSNHRDFIKRTAEHHGALWD